MRKLIFIVFILFYTKSNAQEFSRLYNIVEISIDKKITSREIPIEVFFNYKNLNYMKINMGNVSYIYKYISKVTRNRDNDGDVLVVKSQNGELHYLTIFDNQILGISIDNGKEWIWYHNIKKEI